MSNGVRVGDTWRAESGNIGSRRVTKLTRDTVFYCAILPDYDQFRSCSRKSWRQWRWKHQAKLVNAVQQLAEEK